MIFDIIVLAIMVTTMVSGFRRGFIYSFVRTLSWIGALIGGFIGCRILSEQLTPRTGLEENIYSKIFENVSDSLGSITSNADTLPLILNDTVNATTDSAAEALATRLTNMTMLILSFLLIFAVIKLLCFFITMAFSKRNNDGFLGFADGMLGLIAGMIKGVLIVFLFLMLLMPALNLMSPASMEIALEWLDNSYFAGILYDSNFLVLIIS